MKNTLLLFAAVALIAAVKFSDDKSTVWELDKANSKLSFSLSRILMSPVTGQLRSFDIKVSTVKEDLSDAVAEMTADVASITTGNHKRDLEVQGSNYFDIAKFPKIAFKSNSFRKVNDRDYKVLGILTMHGITRSVTVDVTYSKELNPTTGKQVLKFTSTCTINRFDYKIGSGPSSALVGKEVAISAVTEFVKEEPSKMIAK